MTSIKQTKERVSEGPGGSTRTTTYESTTTTSGDDISYLPTYKSNVAPRNLIIQRTSYGGGNRGSMGGTQTRSQQIQQSYNQSAGVPAGAYSQVTQQGVSQVRNSREQEKRDMQDLNERFAGYIEKVRFLEAQNRRLADELEKLKQKWGKETTAIKAMFQAELDEARKLLDDAEKEKARLEIRNATLEEQIEEIRQQMEDVKASKAADREKIDRQNQQLSDYEAEIQLLRRRLEMLESDREKDKKEIARLSDALNRARIDLDNETLNHIDAENRRQTLEEELEFLKQVHEQELKELAALAYRDTTAENREFWKSEMAQALREIQQTYDEKLGSMRGELETYYNMKIQEFRTGATRQNMEAVHSKEETKRLRGQMTDFRQKLTDLEARNAMLEKELELLRREHEEKEREWETENTELKGEVAKLRAEMEAILKELQDIMDTKLGLELEIAAYRKLLEGEENRLGLKTIVDSWVSSGQVETTEDQSLRVSQVVKGEMSAKTTYQRSAKGPVAISETDSAGQFITLENTGRKNEQLGDWKVVRNADGRNVAEYNFDRDFTISPGRKIKIFTSDYKGQISSSDLVNRSCKNWGLGANITTKLINERGEERAAHQAKTMYSS